MINELKEIMKIQGVSSREGKIGAKLAEMVKPYVDKVSIDPLGNVIAVKRGKAKAPKKIMFCAHMDEIGFVVNYIQDNGLVRVSIVGGINFAAAAFTRVVFENGARGVIVPEGKVEPKDYAPDKFYIDLGVKTKRDAERKVKIGETLALESDCVKLGGQTYAGRPFDDRIGCYVLTETAKKLKDTENDIYFVFSVQEEVGCRGALPAAFSIAPDYALCFDVTGTGDTPAATPMACSLGGGAAIKIKDGSVICSGEVVAKLQKLATENKITSQNEILLYGGTDTSVLQAAGIGAYAGCISIPSRYIHSGVEMIDLRDVDACTDLATAFALDPTL